MCIRDRWTDSEGVLKRWTDSEGVLKRWTDSEGVLKRWTDFCKACLTTSSAQTLPYYKRPRAPRGFSCHDGSWRGLASTSRGTPPSPKPSRHPLQSRHARHRGGRTQTRETTTEPVRQRQGLDGDDLPTPPSDGCQQNSLQEDGSFFCLHVPPTTAKVEGVSERVSDTKTD